MTERKPPGVPWEHWIERQIREAEARGEFENLPGKGKPIEDLDRPHDPLWWVKQLVKRENLSAWLSGREKRQRMSVERIARAMDCDPRTLTPGGPCPCCGRGLGDRTLFELHQAGELAEPTP